MITNLYSRIAYKRGQTNLPLVIIMHGWDGEIYSDYDITRMANYGFLVNSVAMRARKWSYGAADASGIEAHDIYDAVVETRKKYGYMLHPNLNIAVGYSGGGGNILNCACKYPDTFSLIVDVFGMSDYGEDSTYGWYYQNAGYQSAIESRIGGTPVAVPNNYIARNALRGILNYTGGHLLMCHDSADSSVMYNQSTRVKDVLDGAGRTNYQTLFSTIGDTLRYEHTMVGDSAANLNLEAVWTALALTKPAWTIEAAATKTVLGHMVTKRFKIYLGNGKDHAATVNYNTATKTYIVTPITSGSMAVRIEQDGLVATQTISSETTIVLS